MAIQYSWTFILRKLHQLTGVVPLGIFFFVHMFTNAKALNGEESFEKAVADIHAIPFLLLLEIFGIFIPLLFHSIYGVIISMEARPNVGPYPYARNWFYIVQRATGIFLFVFLTFHILNLRFGLIPGLNLTPVAGNADLAFDIVAIENSRYPGSWRSISWALQRPPGILLTASGYSPWIGESSSVSGLRNMPCMPALH
jgi:succinate dehydrogenase/fumarate reductase cytochrome b subunit (b558 family)